jgi:hypothetical protein
VGRYLIFPPTGRVHRAFVPFHAALVVWFGHIFRAVLPTLIAVFSEPVSRCLSRWDEAQGHDLA